MLCRTYTFKSGDTSFTLPAGKYVGNHQNNSGIFYDAPSRVKSSSWTIEDQNGIFLNNSLRQGFTFEYKGAFQRPVRFAKLPSAAIGLVKKVRC